MENKETIVITGGTGLVGNALTKVFVNKGYDVIIVTRSRKSSGQSQVSYAVWDPSKNFIEENVLEKATVIINLAGAGVADKRWTGKRKKEIVESRVSSGRTIVKALAEKPNKVHTVISASAIGWYGHDEKAGSPFKETAQHAGDFLGSTCFEWEEAIRPVTQMAKRLVIFRIGIVLDKSAGAYPKLTQSFKFRTMAWLGSGKQVISWIHVDDLAEMFLYAVEHKELKGVFNAVASQPISNKAFMKAVAKQKRGMFIPMPVPAIALKAALGEMSVEVLKSATVSNDKIKAGGFAFKYADIETAVRQLES